MKQIILILAILIMPSMVNAEKVTKQINYKIDIDTPTEKIEYLYSAQEALRLEHNAKGKDFRDRVMTEAEWELWQDEYFLVRSDAISMEIMKAKDELKQSKKYMVDLENDFKDK